VPTRGKIIKSAGRVLAVLEFFDDIRQQARVGDVSQALSLPQSSTSVLLKCLTELGYLDYDPATRAFLPTPRVALLGSWLSGGPVHDGRLRRMMEHLSRKTDDTIILAARHSIYAQYLHVIQARRAIRFHVPPSSRRLLVWSAAGFALIAGLPNDEISLLVRRTNAEKIEGYPRIDVAEVLANVRHVRQNGFSVSRALVTPGSAAIAVPLEGRLDRNGRPLAIVVSGGLSHIAPRSRETALLIRASIEKYLDTRGSR
jgi:DNA-binding IclR family transcriptional regulator